jgi:hypothetical protein
MFAKDDAHGYSATRNDSFACYQSRVDTVSSINSLYSLAKVVISKYARAIVGLPT